MQVELVHKEKRFIKLMSKPNVDSFQRFSEDLAAVKLKQTKLTLNRPIHCGMVILDLAKLLMYDFYYNVLKKIYGDKLKLLFTDTDSLCISVETDDIYYDMKELFWDKMDTSEYPKDHKHKLHSEANKKALGYMKDELKGQVMIEMIGLRSKMYSLLVENMQNLMACKGISTSVKNHIFQHSMYYDSLFQMVQRRDNVSRIGSHNHRVYTYETNKISLSPFDDKRYVLQDQVNTLAYGHFKIQQGLADLVEDSVAI